MNAVAQYDAGYEDCGGTEAERRPIQMNCLRQRVLELGKFSRLSSSDIAEVLTAIAAELKSSDAAAAEAREAINRG